MILKHSDRLREFGGPGSGNFGHAGRPGERGGSSKGNGGGSNERGIRARLSDIEGHDIKMSTDEHTALQSYISRDYQKINGALYGKIDLTPEIETTIKSLDGLIDRCEIDGGGVTYSGIGRSGIDALKDITPGDSIKYSGFISSSVSKQYAIDAFASNAMMEISSNDGDKGYFVGGKESELIMPRNQTLKCIDIVTTTDNKYGYKIKTYKMERTKNG